MLKSTSVLAAAVLAAAGLAAAGSASAATITPAGTGFTLSGDLTMSQSTEVECAVTLTGTTASDGSSASITGGSFAAGDWQCGWLVTPSSFPWSVTLNGGSSITISGIGANSILGNCAGSITTNWSGGVTFAGATIPGSPSTCSITGTLTSSPSLTVS